MFFPYDSFGTSELANLKTIATAGHMVGIRALNHRDTDRAFAEEGALTFWRQSLREGLTRSVDTFAIREYNMRHD